MAEFSPSEDRQEYTRQEVASLLRHAAERQRAQDAQTQRAQPTLDLSEVERVAEESGIDPAHVRHAAKKHEAGNAEFPFPAPGKFESTVAERLISFEGSQEAVWERLVSVAREEFDAVGEVTRLGKRREWRVTSGVNRKTGFWSTSRTPALYMTAVPEEDMTRVRIASQEGSLPATFGVSLLGGVLAFLVPFLFVVAGVTSGPLLYGSVAVAALVTCAAAFFATGRWDDQQQRRLERVLDRTQTAGAV